MYIALTSKGLTLNNLKKNTCRAIECVYMYVCIHIYIHLLTSAYLCRQLGRPAGTTCGADDLPMCRLLYFYSLRRSSSAPSLIELRDDFIAIPEDYVSAMTEIDRQRRQIREMRVNQANRELQTAHLELLDERQATEVRKSTGILPLRAITAY